MTAPRRKLLNEYYTCPFAGEINNLHGFLRYARHARISMNFQISWVISKNNTFITKVKKSNDVEYDVALHLNQVFFEVKERKRGERIKIVPKFYIDAKGNEHTISLYHDYGRCWYGGLLCVTAATLLFGINVIPGVNLLVMTSVIIALFMKGVVLLCSGGRELQRPLRILSMLELPLAISMIVSVALSSVLLTNPAGLIIGVVLVLLNIYSNCKKVEGEFYNFIVKSPPIDNVSQDVLSSSETAQSSSPSLWSRNICNCPNPGNMASTIANSTGTIHMSESTIVPLEAKISNLCSSIC